MIAFIQNKRQNQSMVLENRTGVTSGEKEGSVKTGARGASGVFIPQI